MFKVSVIITVYNTGKYLRQCLDCVVNQTLRDIEIICVNDGSTDNSLDILNEYAVRDKRIKVINKENEGLGGAPARNLGLTVAQGKYVSILDSDDTFELDMLNKMAKKAEDTNVDIVVCGGMEYDNRNGHKAKVPSILNEKAIPEKEIFSYKDCPNDIYQLTQGMAWNKLFRRAFLDKHNLRFQRIKYTDDAYFVFAYMVLAEKITIVNEPLAYYHVCTGSSQTDLLAAYPESAYLPYVELKKSLIDWGIYETVKQSFVNCATSFIRYFYDKIGVFEAYEFLHNKLRDEIFSLLDINSQPKDFFYDARLHQWQKQVSENSAGELAFMSARSFGCGSTTAALRFRLPSSIPINSKIVLFGAGIMGRHYYSSIMLSAHCDVVLWCEIENHDKLSYIHDISEIGNLDFDLVLIAYAQPRLIKNAIDYLNNIGIPNEKIILGGTEL
jgi:glycosyltransferase involved in cell wall biosynthesis